MKSAILSQLYNKLIGSDPTEIIELPASGSNRRYFRLLGNQSLIGVIGTCKEENETFIYLAKHFKDQNLPVPKVLIASDDNMAYLQEDLGDEILFKAIEKGRLTRSFSNEEKDLLIKTIRMLPDIQFAGAVGLDFNKCYPLAEFDTRTIMWQCRYPASRETHTTSDAPVDSLSFDPSAWSRPGQATR